MINYYGSQEELYRKELDILLANHSVASSPNIDIYPTKFGLGHRFHVFEEHGYAVAQAPLILILDDDVTTTCDGIHKLVAALTSKTMDTLYQNGTSNINGNSSRNNNKQLKSKLPFSSLVAMSIERGADYKKNGNIQYVYKKGKGIALTTSLLLPVELIKFFTSVVPESVLAPLDENKNCEDILMNYISAFLNENHATMYHLKFSKFIPELSKKGKSSGLSTTKNTMFHRSSCIYWIDKLFRPFDTKLLPMHAASK